MTFCGLETEMSGARLKGKAVAVAVAVAEKSVKGNDWHLEGGKVMRSAHNDGDEVESEAETFEKEAETDQM